LSACNNPKVTDAAAAKRPILLAVTLIVAGVIGWFAAFSLTVEKFALLADPDASLGCDLSVLVQCRANLESWQGSLFGFPNPILGLTGWMAPVVVGAALLAGASFHRWFWIVFNLGVAFAMALVLFLIYSSIFVLGTLCPWCMVTWVVTIPTFLIVTLHNLRSGAVPLPPRLRAVAASAYGWIPVIALFLYLVVAVAAQLRLDVINHL
jgi:uncharacterized membrane protein